MPRRQPPRPTTLNDLPLDVLSLILSMVYEGLPYVWARERERERERERMLSFVWTGKMVGRVNE